MAAADAQLPADLAHVQNILSQQGIVSSGQFGRTRHNSKRQRTSRNVSRPQSDSGLQQAGPSRCSQGSSRPKPRLKGSDAHRSEEGTDHRGRQQHCKICGCNVGAGSQSWHTHVEGIQHRRRALSLQHTGSAEHHITSAFEDPQGEEAGWTQGGSCTRQRPTCQSSPIPWTCSIPRISIQALKMLRELVGLSGARTCWNQNSWRFTEASLEDWADKIQAHSLCKDHLLSLLLDSFSRQDLPLHPDCGVGTCWAMQAHASDDILIRQLRHLDGKLTWHFPGGMNAFPAAVVAFHMMARRLQAEAAVLYIKHQIVVLGSTGSSELQEWHLDFSRCVDASLEEFVPCQRMLMRAMRGLMQESGTLRLLQCKAWRQLLPDKWAQEMSDVQWKARKGRKMLVLAVYIAKNFPSIKLAMRLLKQGVYVGSQKCGALQLLSRARRQPALQRIARNQALTRAGEARQQDPVPGVSRRQAGQALLSAAVASQLSTQSV
ncbi:hypothetical protein WJX74_009997 [Apatococcus lobatus]|uniref:Uncharacterized protein n=1 Tax=Apatococcus lobatus TaxID=904363 RepID=A0AAW1RTD1_9CHLO